MQENAKNRSETTQSPEQLRCSAYCDAASFDFPKLMAYYNESSITFTEYRKGAKVIHRNYGAHIGDVFLFPYGVVVMWGLSQQEESFIRRDLEKFQVEPASYVDSEIYTYSVDNCTKITGGHISLPSSEALVKLAISHGFAQSVKLGSFEKRIEKRIEDSKYLSEHLASRGRIPLNRRDTTKMQGSVFIDRSLVNLHSDILDTPEFFWEYSEIEPLYTMISNDLDIKSRVSVLNKRMDILKDLFDMLGDELHARHSSFLELVIVLLIALDIVIVLAKEYLSFG